MNRCWKEAKIQTDGSEDTAVGLIIRTSSQNSFMTSNFDLKVLSFTKSNLEKAHDFLKSSQIYEAKSKRHQIKKSEF